MNERTGRRIQLPRGGADHIASDRNSARVIEEKFLRDETLNELM